VSEIAYSDEYFTIRVLAWGEAPDTTVVLSRFLRNRLVPFAQKPSVEIEGIESAGGDQIVADAENLLRMLGAVK
jgi:hypothetical protein